MGCNESKERLGGAAGERQANRQTAEEVLGGSRKSGFMNKQAKDGGFQKSDFVQHNEGRITDKYDFSKGMLGEGSFGSVKKAVSKSGQEVAVKVIAKQKMKNLELFRRETEIMRNLDHPNCIKLFEIYEDRKRIYLVMEIAEGGELFDRIVESGSFQETQAAAVIQQILRSVFYLHSNKIAHRDLKPENFLVHGKGPIQNCVIKTIDFGLSMPFEEGKFMKSRAGTPYYVAPEVLFGRYNEKCDVWSVGVIMYVLLCGYPPFNAKDDNAVLEKVKKGEYAYKPKAWGKVSNDAKALIDNMLIFDFEKRWSAEAALNDKWVAELAPEASTEPLDTDLINNINVFKNSNRVKKMAINVIAHEVNENKIKHLREIFLSLDKNGDGTLTIQELKEGLDQSGLEVPKNFRDVIENIDTDGSGCIQYSEFLSACLDRHLYLEEDAVWGAFAFFDKDNDGKISLEELRAVLKDDGVQAAVGQGNSVEELLQEMDKDHNGVIDFDEFMTMMRGKK